MACVRASPAAGGAAAPPTHLPTYLPTFSRACLWLRPCDFAGLGRRGVRCGSEPQSPTVWRPEPRRGIQTRSSPAKDALCRRIWNRRAQRRPYEGT